MLKNAADKNIQCAHGKTLQLTIKPAGALHFSNNLFGTRIKLELGCSVEEIHIA